MDVSIFEAGGQVDFGGYESPEMLAKESAVALVGRIDGFEDGHTVLEAEGGLDYPDIRVRNVVVRVEIDQVFKSEGVDFPDGLAYVSLARGVEVIDAAGEPVRAEGTPSTITDVRAFADALPVGTKVVVISSAFEYPRDAASTVVDRNAGRPAGSTLLSGGHPQNMSVQYGTKDRRVTGWPGLSLDELAARLAAAYPGR